MDADRFDTLAKRLGAPTSRRAALGASVAGGFLGALGIGRAAPAASAAQGGACVMAFVAQVLQGSSTEQPLIPQADRRGELRGDLSFALSPSGNLENATLTLLDGTSLPVVGQAAGHSLQMRIELAPRVALVAVGVGEQEIARCQGAVDGVATGPQVGDLGDWHAAGVQQARGGGGGNQGAGQTSAQGGNNRSGNRTDRGGEGVAATGAGVSGGSSGNTGGGGGGGDGNAAGSSTGSASGANAPSCPPAEIFCDLEEGYCANLQTDSLNCGQCGLACASELGAGACIDGACACSPGTTRCDDVCVNTDRDPLNCGGCGNVCADDVECIDGGCAPGEGSTGSRSVQDCPSGQTRCGDACVDLQTDPDNCGACGNLCPVSPEIYDCEEGTCVPPSCDPLTNCGGLCVDLQTDPLHCSACGLACAADEACSGGLCVPIGGGGGCKTGLTPCGPTCADLQTDENNCGACGAACPAGEACEGGECAPGATAEQTAGCPEGQILCGAECRNGLTTADGGIYCSGGGSPPTACPPGQSLCNGACYTDGACQPTDCPPGWGRCYGICKDFSTDPGYCGGCETACPGAICSGGQCTNCAAGLTPCGAACVDTATDLNNCGFCGNLCGTQCLDGQCLGVGPAPTSLCSGGQTPCGGVCVDTTRDNANCGQCGNVCNEANVCSGGRCVNSDAACAKIAVYLSACGTRCADTRTDPEHCGGCDHPCGPGSECRGGMCTVPAATSNAATLAIEESPPFSCPEGQVDCGGVCTDVSFDPLNCGGCGVVCESGGACDFGVCGAAPAAPAAPEGGDTACVDVGGACDPASPGACCSGACNDDGVCA